jgi:hypothetical protein
MYCWHTHYAIRPGAVARLQRWVEQDLAPVLRGQGGLRAALLMPGETFDQAVLDTWWEGRADVERFLATAAFHAQRQMLDGLDLLREAVCTRTHTPACPLPG